MTFGAFISTRRKEAKLNLRDTAKHLGISNGYLCDIEQGRRPAPEGAFVERISSLLELDKQEHEMLLDLAADSRQTVSLARQFRPFCLTISASMTSSVQH